MVGQLAGFNVNFLYRRGTNVREPGKGEQHRHGDQPGGQQANQREQFVFSGINYASLRGIRIAAAGCRS